MGIFDKAKEAIDKTNKAAAAARQQQEQRRAEEYKVRGDKLNALSLEYMGGYQDISKAKGTLVFYQKQIEFNGSGSARFIIPASSIVKIAVEGKDEVTRRVTATRLLLVGIFAFAVKKKSKDKEAYITLVIDDGQEAIFFIDKISPMELRTKLAKVISQVKQVGVAGQEKIAQTGTGSIADELTKLAGLKQQGILTQAEFDKKKSELLN